MAAKLCIKQDKDFAGAMVGLEIIFPEGKLIIDQNVLSITIILDP